ncbi:uncharacterized protein LOC121255116 [Juglans microcarpa x Juglans regia]|uniref:uncharacterized protein LOC121255116 n=1 Tax=Juglans microcarpa x Juglans regia TaxID=2249226 RepID=UPI001B7EB0FE|nr:uncharacterized protein LOC121255116 [Juglans microcarpa x Juglans regia]
MKTLSWNCRGLGNPRTVQDLVRMIRIKKPSLVFLMETKLKEGRSEVLRKKLGYEGCFNVNARGRSGGWTGSFFTWCNNHSDETFMKERIDRVVANARWSGFFDKAKVEVMATCTFDHSAIILHSFKGGREEYVRRRNFKYEVGWSLEESCGPVVKAEWDKAEQGLDSVAVLQAKLKRCSKALSQWSKYTFIERDHLLRVKTERLREMQAAEEWGNIEVIKGLREEVGIMLEQEDLKWRQRSKTHWYQMGDMNAKFFHSCATERRMKS